MSAAGFQAVVKIGLFVGLCGRICVLLWFIIVENACSIGSLNCLLGLRVVKYQPLQGFASLLLYTSDTLLPPPCLNSDLMLPPSSLVWLLLFPLPTLDFVPRHFLTLKTLLRKQLDVSMNQYLEGQLHPPPLLLSLPFSPSPVSGFQGTGLCSDRAGVQEGLMDKYTHEVITWRGKHMSERSYVWRDWKFLIGAGKGGEKTFWDG